MGIIGDACAAMKVLQIECVVPDLIFSRPGKLGRVVFKFEDDDRGASDQYDIDAAADAGHNILEENGPGYAAQSGLKNVDLANPSVALRLLYGKIAR